METQNKNGENDFHAVDFMRQVRSEMTEKYLQDKGKYWEDLKKQWMISSADRKKHLNTQK